LLIFKYNNIEYDVIDVVGMLEPYEIDEFMKCLEFFENLFEMNSFAISKKDYSPGNTFTISKEPEVIKDGNWTIRFTS
jgi:hypothetical protein